MTESSMIAGEPGRSAARKPVAVIAGALGLIACGVAVIAARDLQWNVVTYTSQRVPAPDYLVPTWFALWLLVLLAVCAFAAARRSSAGAGRALGLLWPLMGAAPLAIAVTCDLSVSFSLSLLMILGYAAAAARVAANLPMRTRDGAGRRWAMMSLLLLIVLATVVHTRLQINFFEHFMLGHADFGHFTEELKNALNGRGLRSDTFPNTRLGWHFVPLLYVLVPGYALWPSPVYLMFIGALVVHLPAWPVYACARRLSGSTLIAWLFGAAWLLLPSQSRLVYSNTYGFQWIYVAMPLLVAMVGAGLTGRWRLSMVLTVVVLLLKETAAAATFGWGLYMLLFTRRRRSSTVIVVGSIAYALLCVYVLIPHFAVSEQYERMTLFGDLGTDLPAVIMSMVMTPVLFFERLLREQSLYFLLILLVPMALLPIARWRLLVAAVPSLGLILLLDNAQWLSVKFWHQATVLPVLFMAAVATLVPATDADARRARLAGNTSRRLLMFLCAASGFARRCATPSPLNPGGTEGGDPTAKSLPPSHPAKEGSTTGPAPPGSLNLALAVAVCAAAAWGHYFYGFSPLAKSYEMYADNVAMHRPDPRMVIVEQIRAAFGRDKTILATERLAAHFTDYARVYTGSRPRPADVVVIDRADRWDTTKLPGAARAFEGDPDYDFIGEFDSIIVFARAASAPPIALED